MATANRKKDDAPAKTTELAERQSTEIIPAEDAAMYEADAGAGMEGATSESYAIPFLTILQKGSPQVDETSGVAIDGARQGMIYENVTGRMFDGKTGVRIVPCAYRRVFLRWAARGSEGGGFKGELAADEVAKMRDAGAIKELEGKLYVPLPDGSINEKKCDRISDTRNHYVLLLDDEGGWTTALMSLTSTQIKKSKLLSSMIASAKMPLADGRRITPASWANIIRLTSIPESNDKGSWMGARFEMEGFVKDRALYAAGKAFHDSVIAGHVQAKYEDTDGVGGGAGGSRDEHGGRF